MVKSQDDINEAIKKNTPYLDRYGRDLTKEAGEGRLGPFAGRRKELLQIIQTLARSTKNNPVLSMNPELDGEGQITEDSRGDNDRRPEVTEFTVAEVLAQEGLNTRYAIRELRPTVEQFLQIPLSRLILSGDLKKHKDFQVVRDDEKLSIIPKRVKH